MYPPNNANYPTYPYGQPPNYPPSAGDQGYQQYPYTGTLGAYKTEREQLLERRLAQAEGSIDSLEQQNNSLQRKLAESQRRLYQWRINIRNSLITLLSLFIVLWATVSILVRYPVLPWDMPNAITHILGH